MVRPARPLIALIDGATGHLGGDAKGLTSAYQNYDAPGGDPEGLVDLVIVTSDFSPELQAYYGEEAREWLASLERRASATGRRCWPIACPNWHRRVPKRYPRPPLPVPLAAAGCAACRLASVLARTRRSQGTLLAGLR